MRRVLLIAIAGSLVVALIPAAASAAEPYDWTNQVDHEYDAGWIIGPCGGEAPVACAFRQGAWKGVIGHGALPVSNLPSGLDGDLAILKYIARDIIKSFEKDRAIGCPDYRFVADPVRPLQVAYGDGLSVGFSLERDGRTTELNTWRLVVEDGYVHWITVGAANKHQLCVGDPDAPIMSLTDWRTFEAAFDEMAANSLLGPPLGF